MKNLLITLITILYGSQCKVDKCIPVTLIINGSEKTGEKLYLVTKGGGYPLAINDNSIKIPDTINYPYELILIYKKNRVLFSVPYSDAKFLKIYHDTRKNSKELDSISSGDWSSHKYNSRYKYLIDYGNGMIAITVASNINYLKRFNVTE